MKNMVKRAWSSLHIIVVSLLLGILIGGSVAFAADNYPFPTLDEGEWNWIGGEMDNSPYYYYVANYWMYLNEGKTEVDIDNSYRWYGEAENEDYTWAGLYMYDVIEVNNDFYFSYWGSVGSVDGTHTWGNTDCTLDELGPDNNLICCEQKIDYRGGCFTDYVYAWTE